ncbi:MAG: T9SS type A sorting domain-containing protein [Muribaculum sp.]|nr:T9SS type A sorting domain-containing protein [Muribaculum sp.]
MKILHYLFTAILSLTALNISAAMTGDWKIFPAFDNSVEYIFDTPGRVYFMGYPHFVLDSSTTANQFHMTLFYYDKEADEIIPMSRRNFLSENLVLRAAYNSQKKYLVVVYNNYNIDLIHDNGHIDNIGSMMSVVVHGPKEINDITFYNKENAIYLATTFGYVCLDDEKLEIREARDYGQSFKTVGRVGDRIVLATSSAGYIANAADPRFNLDDYGPFDTAADMRTMLATDDDTFYGFFGIPQFNSVIRRRTLMPGSFSVKEELSVGWAQKKYINHSLSDSELQVIGDSKIIRVNADGMSEIPLPDKLSEARIATCDSKNVWAAMPRKGLCSYKIDADNQWSLTRDFMLPNTTSVDISFSMVYNPSFGMLIGSHGLEGEFQSDTPNTVPFLLSSYRKGFWDEHSPTWKHHNINFLDRINGLAVDPNDHKYVYRGSFYNGLTRVNLEDPEDILRLTRSNDHNGHAGFIKLFDAFPAFSSLCSFRNPVFDNKGNLFVFSTDFSSSPDLFFDIWRWTPENRAATKDKDSYRPMERLRTGLKASNIAIFSVLKNSANEGKFLIRNCDFNYEQNMMIYDTNNTFTNASDDKYTYLEMVDQDGNAISGHRINNFMEDPQTGLIWFAATNGVYTFNLRQVSGSTAVLNRVKVARNDGTSLADYLLNEVFVNHIMDDGLGHKWFSTAGGGLVCTSSDGRKILGEFTSENSLLPDDIVYSTCYNPENGSIMVSTNGGLAEFFPSGMSSSSEADSEVRVYPNPVEPDYYGYVTIDNLPENCLVKIVDSQGGLVRELGIAENGSIQWDVMGLDFKRVRTGIYFILASGSANSDTGTAVGKVLVMN